MGSSSPSARKVHSSPYFSAHVYCSQTAGWIKMPHGTEIDLGPGHIELDGDPVPRLFKRAPQPTTFRPWLLWPNDRGDVVLDGDPASPPRKGTQLPLPPTFRPSLLRPARSPISVAQLTVDCRRACQGIIMSECCRACQGMPFPSELPLPMGIWTPI